MNLFWGVSPILRSESLTTEEMVATAEQELCRRGLVSFRRRGGDSCRHAIIDGSTNFMRLQVVGGGERHTSF